MSIQEVYWSEGMFLRPQHFQAAQKQTQLAFHQSASWDHRYNWGLRHIEIDEDALRDYKFRVTRLEARLKDTGTLVSVSDPNLLTPVDLKPYFQSRRGQKEAYIVRVLVPKLRPNANNVSLDGRDGTLRFRLDQKDLNDENTGADPSPVEFRTLNFRLDLSERTPDGYEDLCIARVSRSASNDATPELDPNYIPPLLACDAWKPLQIKILQASILHRLGKWREPLVRQAVKRGSLFDGTGQGELPVLLQLWTLNEGYALLDILASADGVHPLQAYAELARLVGRLAVFTRERTTPKLPRYDHDDLYTCFSEIVQFLDRYMESLPKAERAFDRPFVGRGFQMQVALEREWVDTNNWHVFIQVDSDLPTPECSNLLTAGGQVNMKLASCEHAEEVFARGRGDLRFNLVGPTELLPELPVGERVFYLRVNPESQPQEWNHVRTTGCLALRVNHTSIQGRLDGQDRMTLRYGRNNPTIRFTLYVVPKAAEKP